MPAKDDRQLPPLKKKVFIVHGHDTKVRNTVVDFVRGCDLEPIVLQEKADKGRTVIEKFEEHAGEVGYAIVLLTPDDRGGVSRKIKTLDDLEPRARQNVIFELGFFYGKLGRKQVCALLKGNIEIPSDISGVLWIKMDKARDWQQSLRKELLEAGLAEPSEDELLEGIDWDKLQQSMAADLLAEALSTPKLSFKLITQDDGSPCDEAHLGDGSPGFYPFTFVLENNSPTVPKVKGVKIDIDIGWEGSNPVSAIDFRLSRIPSMSSGWKLINGSLRDIKPAQLSYEDLERIVVYKHPERWGPFQAIIPTTLDRSQSMKGWFNIDYRVSIIDPYYQMTGTLKLRFE